MGVSRLREVREARGLSQATLAARVKISQQAIAQYEKGIHSPAGDILVRIAHALGVSSAYLLGMTDDPTRDDRLPPDWEQAVEEAISMGFTAEEVREVLRAFRRVLGKDKGVEEPPADAQNNRE